MKSSDAAEILDSEDNQQTLLLFGGIALMTLGAGLLLTAPVVRRYLGGLNLVRILQNAAPEVQRFLRLKSM